jgi:hypothetical protein
MTHMTIKKKKRTLEASSLLDLLDVIDIEWTSRHDLGTGPAITTQLQEGRCWHRLFGCLAHQVHHLLLAERSLFGAR